MTFDPRCSNCGQIVHEECCQCGKRLPDDHDDYVCDACIKGNIRRGLESLKRWAAKRGIR